MNDDSAALHQKELEDQEYQEILKNDPGYQEFLNTLEKERGRDFKKTS